jgi:hypothetical protein
VVATNPPSYSRVLAVGLDAATVRRWLGDSSLPVETAPDLLQATTRLWEKDWDIVVAGIGDRVESGLRTWLDAVHHAAGRPLCIAVVKESSELEPARPLTLAEAEARHIARVLEQTGGRISEAARILGVHRNTLARKLKAARSQGSPPTPSHGTPVFTTT